MSSLVKKIGATTAASLVSQLIILAATPIVARLYSPDVMGAFGAIMSIAYVLSAVAALRFEQTIVIATRNKHAISAIRLSLIFALFFSIIIVLIDASTRLFSQKEIQDTIPFFGLIPITVLALTLHNIMMQVSIRHDKTFLHSFSTIARAISAVLIQIIPIVYASDLTNLLLSQVISTAIGCALMWPSLPASAIKGILSNKKRMFATWHRYRGISLYGLPQILISNLSQTLVLLSLSIFFGAAYSGLFWMAQRIIQQPSILLGQSTRQVYTRHIVRLVQDGDDARRSIRKLTALCAIPSLLIVSIIFSFGPDLFTLLLGEKWSVAGEFAMYMSIWCAGLMINIPSWCALQAIQAERQMLMLEIVTVGVQLTGIFIGGVLGSPLLAVTLYSFFGATMFVARSLFAYFYIGKRIA